MGSADILDASKLCYDGDFDTQFNRILQTIRLTRWQVQNLTTLLDDLTHQLRPIWRDCLIHAFGSIVIGLGIKTSDIDCYIDTGTSQPPKDCVIKAREIFKRSPHLFRKVFAITAAKVPIVKLLHLPTNCNTDISFSGPAGVRNSELLAYLLHLDDRAIKLAILVKYWSKVYDFTGTNLMPNYALTMLVVFFLQLKGILPAISVLQKGVPKHMVNGWNTAFNEKYQHPSECEAKIYELLGDFFKYYSTFNYTDDMISPYIGFRLKRKSFSCLKNIPQGFDLYKTLVASRACKALRVDTFMCIQDTFEHNRNCTVAVYPRLAVKIVGHFKFAANLYDRVDSKDFLRKLLTEDPHRPLEPSPSVPQHSNRNRVVKNNKQLLKQNIKDLIKAGLLDVDSFPKRKR
ncbi:terminal uridylyltransferase Tailor-like [Manduca sexta]|uniref:terminal uridylyltransferase Tailor-like n=1 Tax=Manduca sexta TaxID=7130 RepID=UPI00188F788E|nr:terminal uridylyltransferase Tailor-like [Manduca sexta]